MRKKILSYWNLIYDANDCWQKPGDNTKLARLSANDADGGIKNYSRISPGVRLKNSAVFTRSGHRQKTPGRRNDRRLP